MRKEVLIAVVAGIIVGLVVAFGAWRANSAIKQQEDSAQSTSTNSSDQPQTQPDNGEKLDVSLINIEDFDVFTQSPVNISGITKAKSVVVISGEDEDYSIISNPDGTFEQEVDLTAGVNQLLVSVFDRSGENVSKKVTVVYSSEFAKSLNQ